MKSRSLFHFESRLKLLLFTLCTLTLSITASANPDDWGMVQRFNEQNTLASQGNVKAMYDVGKLYERGRGVKRDIAKAAEFFQKASDAGNASAQARLGILYFEGRGVKQDYKKALELLNSAAKQNIPSAQFQLANMYELGTGVRQNLPKAISWYKKADQFGYYLAKAKVTRLQKILGTKKTIKFNDKPQATSKVKTPYPLILTILKGKWLKRKTPVGYLPSSIANCANDTYNEMHCISTEQERSTGSEVITFNTDSLITAINKTNFSIVYSNNVLDVALLTIEDGDGEVQEQAPSRIKKGKQGKKRTLKCTLQNNKSILCKKGSSDFVLVSQ